MSYDYDTGMDLLMDVVRHMTDFIEVHMDHRLRRRYAIWNETTAGENFAERWNEDEKRAAAFQSWHRKISSDLENLVATAGIDQLTRSLGASLRDRACGQCPSGIRI